MKIARRVIRNVKDYGAAVTFRKALKHSVSWLYFRQVYKIHSLDLTKIEYEPFRVLNNARKSGLVFRFINTEDLSIIRQIEDSTEWLHDLIDRLKTGQMTLAALDNGTLAGFMLIDCGIARMPLVDFSESLQTGEAWIEHVAVMKEYRGSHIGQQLLLISFQELKACGISWLYAGILDSNLASLRLFKNIGFEFSLDLMFSKLLFFKRWTTKGTI